MASVFILAFTYRKIMQTDFRRSTASCSQKFSMVALNLLYSLLFLPLNHLILEIVICDESTHYPLIYQSSNQPHSFFGYEMKCYESTAYNVIGSLAFLTWFLYFSLGTFVISKLQFLNRTSPFIMSLGFATMFKLFSFVSVLLTLTSYNFSSIGPTLAMFSLLLLALLVFTFVKVFAFHKLASVINRIGIFLLMGVNLSIVVWIAARAEDFK